MICADISIGWEHEVGTCNNETKVIHNASSKPVYFRVKVIASVEGSYALVVGGSDIRDNTTLSASASDHYRNGLLNPNELLSIRTTSSMRYELDFMEKTDAN